MEGNYVGEDDHYFSVTPFDSHKEEKDIYYLALSWRFEFHLIHSLLVSARRLFFMTSELP